MAHPVVDVVAVDAELLRYDDLWRQQAESAEAR